MNSIKHFICCFLVGSALGLMGYNAFRSTKEFLVVTCWLGVVSIINLVPNKD